MENLTSELLPSTSHQEEEPLTVIDYKEVVALINDIDEIILSDDASNASDNNCIEHTTKVFFSLKDSRESYPLLPLGGALTQKF